MCTSYLGSPVSRLRAPNSINIVPAHAVHVVSPVVRPCLSTTPYLKLIYSKTHVDTLYSAL